MAWPQVPLPPIEVERSPVQVIDGWLSYTAPASRAQAEAQRAPLGHEVAIRELLKLDVDDDDDLLAFITAHGVINRKVDLLDLHVQRSSPPGPGEAHLNDARTFLHVAQCLARHVLAARQQEKVVPAWAGFYNDQITEQIAWTTFSSYLSRGLRAFHARVEFTLVEGMTEPLTTGVPRVGLYSALCHQLFNLFVDEAPVMRCMNETCGQAFVRQVGRAQYGQHRTQGVRYCSKSCARSQAERQRRRRMKGDPR